MKARKNTYIDLFSGCGGLSLGLHNAEWQGLFAVEKSADAFKTLKFNLIERLNHFDWPEWLPCQNMEINEVLENYKSQLLELRGKVDLVAGGPPCQGFSTAGRRREDDVRNGLIRSYLQFIMYVRPKIIFFENVKGFTHRFEKNKSKGFVYSTYVLRALRFFGYDVHGEMIDFSKFGVPQKRTRFILVGVRKDVVDVRKKTALSFFEELVLCKRDFLKGKGLPLSPTLKSALSDLLKSNGEVDTPDRPNFKNGVYSPPNSSYQRYARKGVKVNTPNSHSFPKHGTTVTNRFKFVLQDSNTNANFGKLYQGQLGTTKHTLFRLSASDVAPTITTLPDDFVHYSEPRILTVREFARIQTFPDSFEFKGKYTTGGKLRTKEVPRYTQIGNAIPPLFGEQCGEVLKRLI